MNPRKDLSPELAELQGRLEGARGKKYWRSLAELADSPAFRTMMGREFPEQAEHWLQPPNRRQFLTLMGASLALAGVGCSIRPAPSIKLRPYVRQPEEVVPGKPVYFATTMTLGGEGVGLLVESHLGRPTKIEGNPDHPASLGATDPFHQASVLSLYDPDRSQTVTHLGQPSTWDDALAALRTALSKLPAGRGLTLLTETVVSPTLGDQILNGVLAKDRLPEAKWRQYEPLARDSAHRAAVTAYGEPAVHTYYRLYDAEKKRRTADVLLSLDADFLGCGGDGGPRVVAEFTAGRRVPEDEADAATADMSRLYVVETALTNTGAKADHRLALRAADVELFARALAAELKVPGAPAAELPGDAGKWLAQVAKDLLFLDPEPGQERDKPRPPGTTLVMAGRRQPAAVHLFAHAINERLGNVGKTVIHTDPIQVKPVDQLQELRELVDDMDHDRVEVLVILGGNPVYTAPADLGFAEALQKVPLRFHLSLFQDETSRQCHWHLPEAHYLEAWGDSRAFDGPASVVQPLIEPLYQGRSVLETVAAVAAAAINLEAQHVPPPALQMVRDYWRGRPEFRPTSAGDSFEALWQSALHDGVLPGRPWQPKPVTLDEKWADRLGPPSQPADKDALELVFQPDPTLYDGRFANNGWLQELPKPITRLTWDNAALMSPKTADKLGVGLGKYAHGGEHGGYHQPVVELEVGGRKAKAPVWVVPGCADGSVTVYLGHGRRDAGKIGEGVGFDAYALRASDAPWFAGGLTATKTGETLLLACVQEHHLMENREVVRAGTLREYREKPHFASEKEEKETRDQTARARKPLTLYKDDFPYDVPDRSKWGMAIDLTSCVGCSACVVACQAENNIPVVGKEQVSMGREMHWLRIDLYAGGGGDAPDEFFFQPVPCMHCEEAPCEYVCPTEATAHSADGLNQMIYQRCVGTRFCSNNCPYKVRRFNFFHYADYTTESLQQQYNPDVTVRSRGVMEKCSYCVQRIRQAEIGAQKEGRKVFDGEVLTACQAACPAGAIVFGDINGVDPKTNEPSRVARLKGSRLNNVKGSPLSYDLLAELNTRPRTSYLAALRNVNPDMEA